MFQHVAVEDPLAGIVGDEEDFGGPLQGNEERVPPGLSLIKHATASLSVLTPYRMTETLPGALTLKPRPQRHAWRCRL